MYWFVYLKSCHFVQQRASYETFYSTSCISKSNLGKGRRTKKVSISFTSPSRVAKLCTKKTVPREAGSDLSEPRRRHSRRGKAPRVVRGTHCGRKRDWIRNKTCTHVSQLRARARDPNPFPPIIPFCSSGSKPPPFKANYITNCEDTVVIYSF